MPKPKNKDRKPVQSDYTDDEIAAVLVENRGNMSASARKLSLKRVALKNRVDRTPSLVVALADAREELLDVAEGNLFDAVYDPPVNQNGMIDLSATRFVLSTLGKKRGYTTGQQVSGDPDGAPLNFDHTIQFVGVSPGEVPRDADGNTTKTDSSS